MIDNRRHKRVPFSAVAAVSYKDKVNVYAIEAFIADMSMSGVGLYSETAIEIDRDISLFIEFPGNDGMSRTDSIGGHVVYSNLLGTKYFTGIEFNELINPLRQPFLFERLQRILAWE